MTIARPPSTYEGRTSTGYPTRSAPSRAASIVVTIAPGTFLTPAYGQAGEQLEAYWGPQVPFPKRMGRSSEYGAFVQSIIENDYLNGEVIRLDGALRFPPK